MKLGKNLLKEKIEYRVFIVQLHFSINYVVKPQAVYAMDEILCYAIDGCSFLLHIMVASYINEIPESEDLLSVGKELNLHAVSNM